MKIQLKNIWNNYDCVIDRECVNWVNFTTLSVLQSFANERKVNIEPKKFETTQDYVTDRERDNFHTLLITLSILETFANENFTNERKNERSTEFETIETTLSIASVSVLLIY